MYGCILIKKMLVTDHIRSGCTEVFAWNITGHQMVLGSSAVFTAPSQYQPPRPITCRAAVLNDMQTGSLRWVLFEKSVSRRVLNLGNRLMSYVPDPAKFEVQKTLPDAVKNLSDEQRAGLRGIASHVHAGVAAKDLHDIVYAVAEIRNLCEQDVSGDLHTHPWEEIGSEARGTSWRSGPGVFVGPAAGGWWMNNLQWAVPV